jgi:predicted Zn-dependent protease
MDFAERCDPHYAELQFLIGADRWSRYRATGRDGFRVAALRSFSRAPAERALDHLRSQGATEADLAGLSTDGPASEQSAAVSRIRRGGRDTAIEEFTRNVAPTAATTSAYLAVAREAREAGWPAGAVRVLERLLAVHEDAAGFALLASCWEDFGAIPAARDAADRARRLAPGRAEYHALYGRYSLDSGDSAAAVDAYGEAARLAPDQPDLAIWRARALRQGHRISEAERTLADCLRRFPDNRSAGVDLVRIYLDANRRDEAMLVLAPLTARFPADAEILELARRLGSK